MKTARHGFLRPILIGMVALLVTALLARAFLSPSPTLSQLHGYTMGTQYSIKYRHPEALFSPEQAQKQIDSILDTINRTMSTYDQQSELSRLNQATATDWIPISDTLFTVLQAALTIGEQSEGRFDITVGPLVNLWGFGPEFRPEEIPAADAIAAIRQRTGQAMLELDQEIPAVRKAHPNIYIDLSAIAKGYAVDQIAALFDSQGIDHYLVDIGGEIRARGTNAQNNSWQVGIEKPLQHGRSLHRVLPLKNTALATSGDYRNFFELDGRRYSHLIDPTTGWPVENGATSVTVLAESVMLADAWATALLVSGHARGLRIAEQQGLAVLYLVNQNGALMEYTSSHFPDTHHSRFSQIFLATFLVMGLALIAMAIGVLNGRQPIAGSCGGLGRLGLGCDAGCSRPCASRHTGTQRATKLDSKF
ncbi:MAG: FAD:protein FMN transferase [Nitrosomonas halophila]